MEDDKYYEDQLEDSNLDDSTDTGFPLDEITEKNHQKMKKFETPDFANALLTDTDLMSTKNDNLMGGRGELLGSDLIGAKGNKRKGKKGKRKSRLTSYQNIFRL